MATTRDALIEAAAELLDEGGVAAVTLREVGRRAGVSHNAPYKHFADKQALLAAVVARDLARREAAGRRAVSGKRPLEAVVAMLHGFVRHAQRHPELFRLTYPAARRGRKVAYLTVAAFLFLCFTLASLFWLETDHGTDQQAHANDAKHSLIFPSPLPLDGGGVGGGGEKNLQTITRASLIISKSGRAEQVEAI